MSTSSAPHRIVWSAEEIGFLAGGSGRAAEAVLARLMDGGLVRVSREGLVTAVHQNTYGATTALEAYVLAGLQGTARPIQQVVQVAMGSHEMSSLHQSLVARGMVRPWGNQSRSGRSGLRALLFLLAFASVFAAFAVDPTLFLLTALLVVVAILLRDRGRLTSNGRKVLRYSMRNPRDAADEVALYGLRRGRHRKTESTTHVGSSCSSYDWSHHNCGGSSSCSSSSSSSCSSSSSSCSSSSSSCSSSSS